MSEKPAAKKAAADPLERALAEVRRLNDQELALAELHQTKSIALAGLRAERGDEVLAAEDPASAARDSGRRVSAMVEELESLGDASRRARERRLAGLPAVFIAEADSMDRLAERLEEQAAQLEAESNRLRAALEKHDDWRYSPAQPFVAERTVGGQIGGAPLVVDARGPRYERLRVEARVLRTGSAQARIGRPHMAGGIEADSLDELFAAVHSDPLRVGPAVPEIASWAAEAIEKEKRRRSRIDSTGDGFVPLDAPMRFKLVWSGGVIDQAASHIVRPEPAELAAVFDAAAMVDVGLEEEVS
jgi:hypothetical protein